MILECMHACLALRLPRDALSPSCGIADQDRELGAGLTLQAEQRHESDGLGAPVDHDGPFAVAAGVHRALDPSTGVVLGEALTASNQVGGHPRVVEPANDGLCVVRPELA